MRPLGNRILVERLEGHGIETVSPGGIVIPATCESRARFKNDHYRARVVTMGEEAERELCGDLKAGDEVLLHTWHASGEKLYAGEGEQGRRMFVTPEDVICAVEAGANVEAMNGRQFSEKNVLVKQRHRGPR